MKAQFRKILYNFLIFFMDREKLIFLLSNREERALLGFKTNGYLYDIGWVNSTIKNAIIDRFDQPLPWVTYPFIHFIEGRSLSALNIFEYGSGNSTLFYSKKAASVDSVENDRAWYDQVKTDMPGNVTLFYCELQPNADYANYANNTQKKYDLIIIDGRDRVNCCKKCITALSANGIVVLDDTERTDYKEGVDLLLVNGFKKIDFWGIASNVNYLKCTTVFYRPGNCLDI
jgi:hypothetical protein